MNGRPEARSATQNQLGRLTATYFGAADDVVPGYLFGDAVTDAEYLERLGDFMGRVTDLLNSLLQPPIA